MPGPICFSFAVCILLWAAVSHCSLRVNSVSPSVDNNGTQVWPPLYIIQTLPVLERSWQQPGDILSDTRTPESQWQRHSSPDTRTPGSLWQRHSSPKIDIIGGVTRSATQWHMDHWPLNTLTFSSLCGVTNMWQFFKKILCFFLKSHWFVWTLWVLIGRI